MHCWRVCQGSNHLGRVSFSFSLQATLVLPFADQLRTWVQHRDACHTHSSGSAQGLNTGSHDAINLAWKLCLALKGLAPPELMLASYAEERKALVQKVIDNDSIIATLISGNYPEKYKNRTGESTRDLLTEWCENAENKNFTLGLSIAYGKSPRDVGRKIYNAFAHPRNDTSQPRNTYSTSLPRSDPSLRSSRANEVQTDHSARSGRVNPSVYTLPCPSAAGSILPSLPGRRIILERRRAYKRSDGRWTVHRHSHRPCSGPTRCWNTSHSSQVQISGRRRSFKVVRRLGRRTLIR
jgi:hypothetical protein